MTATLPCNNLDASEATQDMRILNRAVRQTAVGSNGIGNWNNGELKQQQRIRSRVRLSSRRRTSSMFGRRTTWNHEPLRHHSAQKAQKQTDLAAKLEGFRIILFYHAPVILLFGPVGSDLS
jgi:hypothetical protein